MVREWRRSIPELNSVKIRFACFIGIILIAVTLPILANESPPYLDPPLERSREAHQKPEMAMARRRALMVERKTESDKFREVLQSDISPEEKRRAMEAFQAKREAWQAEMLADVVEPTVEEKATSRQRMRDRISQLPKERREMMESRLAMSEEMEKFRAEEKNLTGEQRRERMQQLMERRHTAMELQVKVMEAEAAQSKKESMKRPKNPFQHAMEAERQKLRAALEAKDPQQRREAMEKFRERMERIRETRRQEIDQRLQTSKF